MPGRAITQTCPQCEMPLVLPPTFLGKTVPCSRCGAGVVVGNGEAQPATPPPASLPVATPVVGKPPPAPLLPLGRSSLPKPPHLERATPLAEKALIEKGPSEDEDPAKPLPPRPAWQVGCYVLLLALVVGVTGTGIVVALAWTARSWNAKSPTPSSEQELTAGRRRINPSDYTNAARKSITYAGALVRIDRAEVGKVRYRSRGEILETATPNYLMVTLTVRNKSRDEPLRYRSWLAPVGDDDALESIDLVDDNGVELPLFRIPGADTIERHIKLESTLARDEEIRDTLVFKLPDGYLDDPIPPLYLSLPADRMGDDGIFRFHLPATMIVRRD